jgi:hypothetical protein
MIATLNRSLVALRTVALVTPGADPEGTERERHPFCAADLKDLTGRGMTRTAGRGGAVALLPKSNRGGMTTATTHGRRGSGASPASKEGVDGRLSQVQLTPRRGHTLPPFSPPPRQARLS